MGHVLHLSPGIQVDDIQCSVSRIQMEQTRSNQMGMEVLEGLCVSQSQQQPTLQEKQQRDPFPSRYIQRYSSSLSQGFEDEDLGNSLHWGAPTVATYCPSRPSHHLVNNLTKNCDRLDE